jgi:heme/copper-type cytochrome/quinol oxidase subunit 2
VKDIILIGILSLIYSVAAVGMLLSMEFKENKSYKRHLFINIFKLSIILLPLVVYIYIFITVKYILYIIAVCILLIILIGVVQSIFTLQTYKKQIKDKKKKDEPKAKKNKTNKNKRLLILSFIAIICLVLFSVMLKHVGLNIAKVKTDYMIISVSANEYALITEYKDGYLVTPNEDEKMYKSYYYIEIENGMELYSKKLKSVADIIK